MQQRKFGRIKGQTKSQSTISDSLLHPYEIQIDDYSFTVVNSDKGSNGFEGSFTTLSGAINKIIQYNIANKRTNYTLKEFIEEFNTIKNKIQDLLPL